MTEAADIIRDQRHAWALPGGPHDRAVRFLAKALPGLTGAVVAIMVIAPLFPRGEVSFLLDRKKVAIAQERVRVEKAMYRGQDNQGRPFSLTAGNAVQPDAHNSQIVLHDLQARMLLKDGPAELRAPGGVFDYDANQVTVGGPLDFRSAGGYRLVTSAVAIDLKGQHVTGSGGVAGSVPSGTFSAERIDADLGERTVTLSGRARLTMQPGRLRAPGP